jgi:hypothetical protein
MTKIKIYLKGRIFPISILSEVSFDNAQEYLSSVSSESSKYLMVSDNFIPLNSVKRIKIIKD